VAVLSALFPALFSALFSAFFSPLFSAFFVPVARVGERRSCGGEQDGEHDRVPHGRHRNAILSPDGG
jgi:hypothetical protein